MKTKVCTKCGKTKPLADFNKSKQKRLGVDSHCTLCHRSYAGTYYKKRKDSLILNASNRRKFIRDKMIEYKKSLSCTDCGISDFRVLDFDHLKDKSFSISYASSNGWGWETILKELEKCQPVCSNCHRIRTYDRRLNGSVAE